MSDATSEAMGEAMRDDAVVADSMWRPSRRQVAQGVVGMVLAIVLVIWWLPRVAQTTWGAVFLTLGNVGFRSVLKLFGLMCLGLWCYTFTLTGSLPGLKHVQALIVNLCGSAAGNLFPGGGAAGVAVTYAAFRSWGFARRAISTSIIVTGVWNLLARMVLPVTALTALVFAGGELPRAVVRGGLVGAAAGLILLGLFTAALVSERVTRSFARAVNGVLQAVRRADHPVHQLGAEELITDQRARIVKVVRRSWIKMTFGIIGFFAVYFILFWQSMAVVGLEMPFAQLYAAYAVGRLLSAIGVTPGGVGVTEGGAVAVLVAFGADPAQALSGTVLFSLCTHVMEVPLGILAFLAWAASKKAVPTRAPAKPPGAPPTGGVAPE